MKNTIPYNFSFFEEELNEPFPLIPQRNKRDIEFTNNVLNNIETLISNAINFGSVGETVTLSQPVLLNFGKGYFTFPANSIVGKVIRPMKNGAVILFHGFDDPQWIESSNLKIYKEEEMAA